MAAEDQRLRVQRLRVDLRQVEGLRHGQRGLDAPRTDLAVAEEEGESADLRRELREIGVGLVLREQLEGLVHDRQAVAKPAKVPHALRGAGGDARRGMRLPRLFEATPSILEEGSAPPRSVPRPPP